MQEIQHALSEPFDPADVHFKARVVNGNRVLAIAYIDARAVIDHLDHAAGVGGWAASKVAVTDPRPIPLKVKLPK
jgi:hypothetical protein